MNDRKEYFRKYYLNNKKRIIERNEKWAENNPEKRKEIVRKSLEKNKEKYKKTREVWADNNRGKVRENHNRHYINHREEYIENNCRYAKENKEKHNAQNAVKRAVKKGLLIKPGKCSKCESRYRIEAHHPNYSRPLQVLWVCSKCHHKIHAI